MRIQSGLPVRVAAFVGREQERATLAELVTDARSVTLTGSGGCGKTRLAVEVSGDVASRFSDGAWWVDLQGVSEPRLVAAAVSEAVDVQERSGRALIDTLAEELRSRHLLVVLDNCEHLLDACAELVGSLTSACPRLHVLATSRVRLGLQGEATFGIEGLPVPDPDASSSSAVAAAEATRLFEVRARQVAASFRIGDDNAAAVADICRRLEGIPLAIELAAARARVLAPEQIAAGLSDRFGILTGGPRDAPARQRTLEASLDWSYHLLDDEQRLVLARSSVFAGSFPLDAARAVVAGNGIDGDDVLDLIAGLVEHSLLQVVQNHGTARYRLLDTVRAYARRRLTEVDDPVRLRDRHLEFHLGLAGRAHAALTGGQPEPWVARLTSDLDDLRAAMDHAVEAGELQALVDLTEPIVRFWFDRGLSREVHRRLQDAARAPGTPAEQRVRGSIAAAGLALADGDPASAYRSAAQAVHAARAADVGGALAIALGQRALSGAMSGLSTSEQVDADIRQCLRHAERREDASTRAYVLAFAGAALLHSRSIDAADELFAQAVEVCEANDLSFQLPAAHAGPAVWSVWSGALDRSRRHARRAIELSRRVGRPVWESAGLTCLGAAAALEGEHDRAREWLSEARAALPPRAAEGSLYGMWVRHWQALSAYAAGDRRTAGATAADIVRIGRAGGSRWDESIGRWLQGVLARDEGRSDDARAHLEASRALSTTPPLPWPLGRSLLGLAELAEEGGELQAAEELAHDGLQVLDDYGDRLGAAAALDLIASFAAEHGEPERSLRLLAASHRFHTGAGLARFPAHGDRAERARDVAHSALDAATANACWDAGTALSLTGAVAYARRGRGERRRPRIGWASLTPVESDIVRLVAHGHTNADIGKRLFMSVNTVKKHLSRVYAKLDVGGRADLAAQVARREL